MKKMLMGGVSRGIEDGYDGGYLVFLVASAEVVSNVATCGIAQIVGSGTIKLVFS